jgi:hypothetical protein
MRKQKALEQSQTTAKSFQKKIVGKKIGFSFLFITKPKQFCRTKTEQLL